MGKSVLALDVGTNSLHCMLADLEGRPLSEASAPIEYFTPDGCPSLAREFDPRAVLDGLGRLVGEVLTGSGSGAEDLCAIGVTGQRQGEVFLDGDGREIYCGPNIDLRAVFEGASMDEYLGGEIYATTGHRPSLLLAPARLRWFPTAQALGLRGDPHRAHGPGLAGVPSHRQPGLGGVSGGRSRPTGRGHRREAVGFAGQAGSSRVVPA